MPRCPPIATAMMGILSACGGSKQMPANAMQTDAPMPDTNKIFRRPNDLENLRKTGFRINQMQCSRVGRADIYIAVKMETTNRITPIIISAVCSLISA